MQLWIVDFRLRIEMRGYNPQSEIRNRQSFERSQ